MILVQKKAFLDGLDAVDRDWYLFNFSGVEPTKESEFGFDISSIDGFIENCQSALSATSVLRDNKYIKFLHGEALLPQKGMNPEGLGITCSNLISNANITTEQKFKMMSGIQSSGTMARTYAGEFYEFHFGANLEIDKFVFKFRENAFCIPDYDIEYWDGNAWVQIHTHTGVDSTLQEISIGQTTDRIRFVSTFDSYSNGVAFDICRFIGTGNGDVVPDVSTTWSVLIPKDYSAFNAVLNGTVPFLYCSATGPNAGGDVIITNANPAKGEDVRLINFSVKAETVEF